MENQSRSGVFWGVLLVVLGLILNRFNLSMLALAMRLSFDYIPHWMEVAISAALVADALLVIWFTYHLLLMAYHEERVT